ncbi:Toxin RTX-I translocation ATP-binding protein [Falsiruegeria litorea R37]|uniref:Toxin RTX-I translocation ATP-binding protein n=1 Tax=Falsiruegeria litorea R37 TaxID=1200284 RepID=A0A1Y5TYE6_9RHOB|nr:type I secretion system permease/ATPase [Falsiruegeria litorea]SLN73955.1 Toxin RTX-I translocation ATP-binding protein [Falsiruegeria litorea R37]
MTLSQVDTVGKSPRFEPDIVPALEACILHVADSLDRPITLAALHAAQSGTSGTLSVRDAIAAAERAGLQAGFGARKLSQFDAALTPAILLLKDDRAVVFHGRDPKGRLLIHDPALGEGIGELDERELQDSYTGYALLFRREHRDDIAATAKGRHGHWFWSALAANRWSYTQVILAAVLANVLGLTTSIFIMIVYDRVLPNEATESLIALTLGVGLALLFDFVIKMLRAGFIDRAGNRADAQMGRRIFDQLLNMQMHARKGSTGAMANTLREFETLREFFTSATLVAVVDLPFITLFVGVIYLIGGPLALVPALAVPVVLLTGLAVQPLLSRLAERSFADGQSKQSVLVETVSGIETIKTTGAARQMRARWDEAIERQAQHGQRSRAISQFALNLTGFTQQAAQVLIVFYGVFLITAGEASMGALVASVILTGRALAPLGQLAQTLTRANQARTSYRNLDALMQSESERPEGRSWISRPKLDGGITFNNVYFAYPDQGNDALKGVSFRINPGEKVAILGRIGSGKSTVARLLLGLYQPRVGSVMVDGLDIRQIDPGDLRRNIGSVLQDIWLFSGTVRENISIGAIRPRDHDIVAAARTAGVEDFLAQHPHGYDMMLGERGEGLSGGQRQAITLARALVGRPPILLFDEPTSAMDVQNEAAVIKRLKEAAADSTMVIVTHRTSLLELVDRVIVIEDGKVGADGPKSLLTRHAPKTGSKQGRQANVAAS